MVEIKHKIVSFQNLQIHRKLRPIIVKIFGQQNHKKQGHKWKSENCAVGGMMLLLIKLQPCVRHSLELQTCRQRNILAIILFIALNG